MAFAIASPSAFRAAAPRFARFLAVSAALTLAGCVGNSVYDQLNATDPVGSSFAVSLFKDYSYLARSFGAQEGPAGSAFDAEGSIALSDTDNTIAGLANSYAQKALLAGKGEEVLPEAAPDGDTDAENVRLELLRDLDQGRDKAPDDAARAQADYDCWVMNRRVDSLTAAAKACRRSVTGSLARLERNLNPAATIAPPAPVAPPPVATAQPMEFTITFASRSAVIAPDQLATISQAIAAARTGRQAHITVVGHSDTDENSEPLSLKRANAVKDALVLQGARGDAIQAKGVGQDDLAAQTGDHVREPKNRRVVITLVP
jgi:outer membrane protein OmpA-like peptidoglycan-associated protein